VAAASLTVASCEVARLEVVSAFRRHCAEGRIPPAMLTELVRRFTADEEAGAWEWLPVTTALVRNACQRLAVLPAPVPLRTLDALHLTCAQQHEFTEVYSSDRHMLQAAACFGLRPINILP
jgi:predicted nucleic acid-binding protein